MFACASTKPPRKLLAVVSLEGEADFGVTTLHDSDPALSATRLASDRFGLVCHRDHPLAAGKTPVSTAELAACAFVGLTRLNGVRVILEADRRLPEAARRPAYEVSDVPLLAPLIEQGVGVALLPSMAARSIARPSLVFRPLAGMMQRHIYFIRLRGSSLAPAAHALVELMLNELHRLPGNGSVSVSRRSASLVKRVR